MQKSLSLHLLFLLLTLAIGRAVAPFSASYAQENLMCEKVMTIETKEFVKTTTVQKTTPVVITATTPNPNHLDSLYSQYAQQYGVPLSTLQIIANCESRHNPAALSKNGLYAGLFQFSASTWKSNRAAMGLDTNPELRFNAEEAIKTAAFKISRDGVGAWPTCGKKAVAFIQ